VNFVEYAIQTDWEAVRIAQKTRWSPLWTIPWSTWSHRSDGSSSAVFSTSVRGIL